MLAGAKIVSEEVLKGAHGSEVPWVGNRAAAVGRKGTGSGSPLDTIAWMPLLSWVHWVVLGILGVLVSVFGALGNWDWRDVRFAGDW